jgi:hypothetical protein
MSKVIASFLKFTVVDTFHFKVQPYSQIHSMWQLRRISSSNSRLSVLTTTLKHSQLYSYIFLFNEQIFNFFSTYSPLINLI